MSVSPRQKPDAILDFFHGGLDPLSRTHDEMLAYSLDRMEECHDYVQWMWPLHEPSAFAIVFPVLTRPQVATLSASAEARGRMLAALARFRLFYGLPPLQAAAAEGAEGAAPQPVAVAADASQTQPSSAAAAAAAGGGPSSGGDARLPSSASTGSSSAGSSQGGSQGGKQGAEEEGGSLLPPGFSPQRAQLWAHNGDHNLLRITRIIRSLRFFGLQQESQAFFRDAAVVARWAGLSRRTLAFWLKASEDDVWASMRG